MKEMVSIHSRVIRMSILIGMLVLCLLFINTAGASAHTASTRSATYGLTRLAADHSLRGGPGSHSSSSHATGSHEEGGSSESSGSHTTSYHQTYHPCVGSNCSSGAFDFPTYLVVGLLIVGVLLLSARIRRKRRAAIPRTDIPPYEPMN